MSNEQEQPLTDGELDHQLMELLTEEEYKLEYMVAYDVIRMEQYVQIALYNESEDEPFRRAHVVKLRDYLRTGQGMDKIKKLRVEMKDHPNAMYDWMYGYFLDLLLTDEEE